MLIKKKKLLNNKTTRTTHMNIKGVFFFFCRKFVHLNNPSYSKSTVMVQKKNNDTLSFKKSQLFKKLLFKIILKI